MAEPLMETSAVRWFPVITDRMARPRNNKIPWRLAEIVYEGYSRRYGTGQSLERIAERGGFGILEIADYLLAELKARDEAHKDCHIVARRHNQFQRKLEAVRCYVGGCRCAHCVYMMTILNGGN